jgi:hypothetical protein
VLKVFLVVGGERNLEADVFSVDEGEELLLFEDS